MKKFTLFIAALLMGSMSFAKESSLVFTAACGGSGTADDGAKWTITSDAAESAYGDADGIHYGTNSKKVQYIKLATSDIPGTITKIVVGCKNSNFSDAAAATTVSVKVGDAAFGTAQAAPTYSDKTCTFTGSAEGAIEIEISRASEQLKALWCKSVVVTYTPPAGYVAQPSITSKQYFITSAEVSMSAESGLEIYYTTDGTDPDLTPGATNTSLYSAPFDITSTMTIKAVAKDNSDNVSEVAEKTFTKVDVLGCAAASALAKDAVCGLSDVVVTAVQGANIYVRDESGTASAMIYWSGNPLGVEPGSLIQGFIGKSSPYHGLPELVPVIPASDIVVGTTGTIPQPVELNQIPGEANVNQYVKLINVGVAAGEFVTTDYTTVLSATIGNGVFELRNNFKKRIYL